MPRRLRVALLQALADRAHRTGAADHLLPATLQECRLHRFDFHARGQLRALEALCRQPFLAEMALTQRHAAELEAGQQLRLVAFADHDLGAAAADVDHQPVPGLRRQRVRHARVNESRLLHAGDDFDRVSERIARALEKGLLAARDAQRIGADHAHAARVHVAQPLSETLQAGQRPRRHFLVEPAVRAHAGAEAHHLAHPVDDDQLPVRVAGDD